METTQVKFHADAQVPEGAVYVGSFDDSRDKWDFYLDGDSVLFQFGERGTWHPLFEVKAFANHGSPTVWPAALSLVRAHQSKQAQAATTAPGMTRESMIDKFDGIIGEIPVVLGLTKESAAQVRRDLASGLVDALHPELKPAPAPEPVKSENERVADDKVKTRFTDGRVDAVEFSLGDAKCAICRPFDPGFIEKVVGFARHSITQALDARDARHRDELRKELESLRGVCALVAVDRACPRTATAIRAVPLTIAERGGK